MNYLIQTIATLGIVIALSGEVTLGLPAVYAQLSPAPTPQMSAAEYINRGDSLFAKQDYKAAIADYTQALAINPGNDYAYYNRGNAHRKLEDYQGAIADYTQALAINPENEYAYLYRGMAHSFLGEQQAAIADYTQAIQINPDNAALYLRRGEAFLALKDKQAAIKDYQKAVDLYKVQKETNSYNKTLGELRKLRQ